MSKDIPPFTVTLGSNVTDASLILALSMSTSTDAFPFNEKVPVTKSFPFASPIATSLPSGVRALTFCFPKSFLKFKLIEPLTEALPDTFSSIISTPSSH